MSYPLSVIIEKLLSLVAFVFVVLLVVSALLSLFRALLSLFFEPPPSPPGPPAYKAESYVPPPVYRPAPRFYEPPLEKKPPFVVDVVDRPHDCERVVYLLRKESDQYRVLGFDCEWVSRSGRRPVALLQLATKSGYCALFRLCYFPNYIHPDLEELLEDESFLKVGVGVHEDEKYLYDDYDLTVRGRLDLRNLSILKYGKVISGGLAGLAESELGVKLEKNKPIVCSDWEASQLTQAQIDYAANDALVAVKIFDVFHKHLQLPSFSINHKPNLIYGPYLNMKGYNILQSHLQSQGVHKNMAPKYPVYRKDREEFRERQAIYYPATGSNGIEY